MVLTMARKWIFFPIRLMGAPAGHSNTRVRAPAPCDGATWRAREDVPVEDCCEFALRENKDGDPEESGETNQFSTEFDSKSHLPHAGFELILQLRGGLDPTH